MLAGARIDPDLWSLARLSSADGDAARAGLSLTMLRRTTIMTTSKPFWMISGTGCGSPTVRHESYERAEIEAKRLARSNPGVEFVILKSEKSFQKNEFDTVDYAGADERVVEVTGPFDASDDMVESILGQIFGRENVSRGRPVERKG